MVTVNHLARSMAGIRQPLPEPLIAPMAGREAAGALAKKQVEELSRLYKSYYEAAQNPNAGLKSDKSAPIFAALHPQEAMLMADAMRAQTFYSPMHHHEELHAEAPARPGDTQTPRSTPTPEPGGARGPTQTARGHMPYGMAGRASLLGGAGGAPGAMAAESVQQMQAQKQNFLAQMFAGPNNQDVTQMLGPNACFEDVLMEVMMKIAKNSEKEVAEKIRLVERGGTTVQGFVADRARDAGGLAAGAVGGWFGGVAGAAVGQELGERLVNSYTGGNSQESRQIQFEKLKHMMHKMSEMMSCISNILATMHATNKNTIQNLRG